MIDVIKLIASVLASTLQSRARLEAEILVLRHQLMILRRRAPPKPRLRVVDRVIFLWLYRLHLSLMLFPSCGPRLSFGGTDWGSVHIGAGSLALAVDALRSRASYDA
jgi:hypothetical protein